MLGPDMLERDLERGLIDVNSSHTRRLFSVVSAIQTEFAESTC